MKKLKNLMKKWRIKPKNENKNKTLEKGRELNESLKTGRE